MGRNAFILAPKFMLLVGTGSLFAAIGCGVSSTSHGSPAGTGNPMTPPTTPGNPNPGGTGDGTGTGTPDLGMPSGADLGSSVPTPGFSCSAAGIAAYADQLATAGRASCTQDGVGVVKDDNYNCMNTAITQLNPPYPSASFNIISTLLYQNTQYPFLECTYFVQAATTGVCNTPISPPSITWQNYPFACDFINAQIPGYQWINKSGGTVQVGDILLHTSSDGCRNDAGHIMIVAEVIDSSHFRVAEANALTTSGSIANQDTGVVSNTRIETLNNSLLASGWFRKAAN